jgi:serine-type D-Ala-D-Ala carboxypeptidase/endopeptidase
MSSDLRFRLLSVVLVVVCATPLTAAQQRRFTDVHADGIRSLLQQEFAEGNSGMVIGLLDEHGSRVFSAGKLDNGGDREVDGDTIFEIGSVTKVFTALLLLDAVRRREMKLDDPVAGYLPQPTKVPTFKGKEITLLNLAAQDSGLPWNPDNLDRVLDQDRKTTSLDGFRQAVDAYTAQDLYAFLSKHELTREPGAGFQYSNVGMSLLGHAIALNANADYESLVVDRICRPLKMDATRIKLSPAEKVRLARGHWLDGKPAEHVNFQVQQPAGSLLSTTNDLLKFLAANLGFTQTELTPLLSDMQVIRHADSPRFGKTAMPWFDEGLYNPPGSELPAHGGGGFGNLAFIAFDKKKRRGVVVLTNQMKVNPAGIGWTLLQGLPLTRENITFFVREIVGLGFALETDEKTALPRLMSIYPKSPAGKAGLSVGLVIQKINGASVEGKSLQDCLGMMVGPIGTKVRLDLVDPRRNETKSVELTREKFLTATGEPLE